MISFALSIGESEGNNKDGDENNGNGDNANVDNTNKSINDNTVMI